MSFFDSEETRQVLNAFGENVFIIDNDFRIVWINDYAISLVEKLSYFIPIKKKEDLIGKSMHMFHNNTSKQVDILLNGPFPYETTINLFDKYKARIVVNPLIIEGEKKGYMLTWKDITEFHDEIKQVIEELDTPIIDTALEEVLLIPITGTLRPERIHLIIEKVLNICVKRQADYVILDLTGVTSVSDEYTLYDMEKLTKSLILLGTNVVYAGLSVDLVQKIVRNNISINVKTFQNFNQAVRYIWKEKGYELKKLG